MPELEEALKKIREVKRTAEAYMSFDAAAGGLISEAANKLAAMEELLQNPSPDNIEKCLEKIDSFVERFSPYRSYASDMIDKIASCRGNLQKANT